ncbi:hypothetical protein ACIGW0_27510 [Streptomyces bikiniensis]|uniref:Uncharacterized protein n=1 Tax=Streptomyces bikiniensis TaxID=1896 RepID=A0ABW8D141_STRBI
MHGRADEVAPGVPYGTGEVGPDGTGLQFGKVLQVFALLDVGPAALAFCVASPTIGYAAPLLLKLGKRQSTACSMEIGVPNSAVAMTLAISVLGSVGLAVPAAVYGVPMHPVAALAGVLMTRGSRTAEEPAPAV